MFKAVKNFIYAGKTYRIGDFVSDNIAMLLGNRVEGQLDVKVPQKQIEVKEVHIKPKMVAKARNKAILGAKKSKVTKK
jgi:hypothetical protein